MTMQEVIDEVKFDLTGTKLACELEDEDIAEGVKKVLRELNRYWDETTLIKVPFASCIDTSGWDEKVSSITGVFRTEGIGDVYGNQGMYDPLYAQQWMMFSSGGTMYCLQDYVLNYAAWSTLQSIKNTMSTDLSWEEDKHNHKIYINNYSVKPTFLAIEYIPKITCVEDIKSDYWIDILIRMSTATTKMAVGRIRTRFTHSGAIWTQDGERIIEEGKTELEKIREDLRINANLIQGAD